MFYRDYMIEVGGAERNCTTKEVCELSLNALAKLYFAPPNEAAKVQKRYLKEGGLIFCGEFSSPMEFYERLTHVNQLLGFFPWMRRADGADKRPVPLDEDELMEILDKARSVEIRKLMLQMGDHMRKYTSPQEYATVLEQWCENIILSKQLDEHDAKIAKLKRGHGENFPYFQKT